VCSKRCRYRLRFLLTAPSWTAVFSGGTRYVLFINTHRVADFEHRHSDKFFREPDQPFYRYTKDPRNNSRVVESALDDFLTEIELPTDLQRIYTPASAGLLAHPLSYGSHSLNHYVMASLNEAEQWREIDEN